jgi:hypothetical protein
MKGGRIMPTTKLGPNGLPTPGDLMNTVIAAESLAQNQTFDKGLYLERDALLDDDYLEPSLDDYDDLLSAAQDDAWDE